MIRKSFLAVAAALGAGLLPAYAQAPADDDPVIAAYAKEKARYDAEASRYKAEADMITARTKPLSDLAGDGKVTLGEGAGQLEAWLLSSEAIQDAAGLIAGAVGTDRSVLLLSGDETVDFQLLISLNEEIDDIARELRRAKDSAGTCGKTAGGPKLNFAPIIPMIGALGSVLQSSTEIRGINVDAKDRILLTAVARKLGAKAILPTAAAYPDSAETPLAVKLSNLSQSRAEAEKLKGCLPAAKKSEIAALASVITRHDTFRTAISTANAQGRVRLADAFALQAIYTDTPRVVRLRLEKAGGTLLTRKSVWTALGFPAVAVTGGVVATFIETDPTNGSVVTAGLITCRTGLKGLRAVHRARDGNGSSCRLLEG
jgi:hypothetical protein